MKNYGMESYKKAYLKTGMARAQASAKRTEMRLDSASRLIGVNTTSGVFAKRKVPNYLPIKK